MSRFAQLRSQMSRAMYPVFAQEILVAPCNQPTYRACGIIKKSFVQHNENGVKVNGHAYTANLPHGLKRNDEIVVGDQRFMIGARLAVNDCDTKYQLLLNEPCLSEGKGVAF